MDRSTAKEFLKIERLDLIGAHEQPHSRYWLPYALRPTRAVSLPAACDCFSTTAITGSARSSSTLSGDHR